MGIVFAITVAISCILWWRFLPLPHQDLNYYTEPAYLLAKFGKLAGPGSQYVDLTYQKGIYSYPPGYFIILAGWLKLFGLSSDSLLGYTHLVHVGAMILLWIILRMRYSCSRFISVLVLLSLFPRMAHGRPDLTATLLSLAAWAALPEEVNWGRVVFSGCLAGATLLVSPGFGLAIIVTLTILVLLNPRLPFHSRLRLSAGWLTTAGLFFVITTAVFLTLQNSWTMAYVQFKTNVAIRGAQVNVMPEMHSLFIWVFSIVPFILVAVVPAILVVAWQWKNVSSQVRNVGLAFLGGIAVWFVNNKSQLLLDHHFLCPSKSVFLGVLYSWPKLPVWARTTPLLLLSLISFYYHKADYLYLASPLRQEEQRNAAEVKPSDITAVDSLYFARFYRPGKTLNYEVAEVGRYWFGYREAIPDFARKEMLAGLANRPLEPTMLVVSAYTAARFREREQFNLPCKQTALFAERLHILGRTWNLPAQPFALKICGE
ncbi:MAG: hypothetical protein DMG35_07760 [Acidobacteria bacterium]|nr:MAG: hypothetical protein DMG35_07760 [Acidobacteriota bacterium]